MPFQPPLSSAASPSYHPKGFGRGGHGARLYPGMTLAIEPMVNIGTHNVKVLKDQWTVVTLDGRLSAHYEHSVAVTDSDPILLTDVNEK